MADRACKFCGAGLFRRSDERSRDFQGRQWCNLTCYRNHREPKPLTPLQQRNADMLMSDLRALSGLPPHVVAARLGYKNPGTLARVLHRYQLHDVARPFDRVEWRARNYSRAKVAA